jgi:hypothetical protein
MEHASIYALCEVFGDRVISRGLWTLRSPNFHLVPLTCGEV